MREISNTARSDGYSSFKSENRIAEEATGWEVEDSFNCGKEYYKVNTNIINYVNKKVPLISLFKQFHIHFDERHSPSGWTHNRKCPFPDHHDKTPSFHFNPQEGRFYCFGCKRGGKAVQFLSYYKKLSLSTAAENLAKSLSSIEDIYVELASEKQDKIDQSLLEFSEFIQSFIQKNKSYAAMEFVEKITWGLDLYLTKHVSRSSIDECNLIARLNILKEKLDEYSK